MFVIFSLVLVAFSGSGLGSPPLSKADLLFRGYDCSNPTDLVDVALQDRSCVAPPVKLQSWRNATIQVVQSQKIKSTTGWHCRVVKDTDAFYCGMYNLILLVMIVVKHNLCVHP